MTDYPSTPDAAANPDKSQRKGSCDCDICDAIDCCDLFTLWLPMVIVWRSLRALPATTPVQDGSLGQRIAIRLVGAYQLGVSARRASPVCRSVPNCSAYGIEALRRHGVLRGVVLIYRRLRRCSQGGFDPVPS
ncbi:membrane protein insertion efficiency factor YidD [Flexivirga meconopsidis]|uniref:membrane protein insertion efficiency factor YidD n=1 Tax=Flexivirga meconopsidis TaxID=2977121 RepID=UPI00223E982B|nr:membrane protein insertion efficiency factor YidD [Flexivirga meconopsidis]